MFIRILIVAAALTIQGMAPVAGQVQPLRLVTAPTAGMLPGKSYHVETTLFEGGGVTQRFNLGISDFMGIGVSYSGGGVIGSQRVAWQPHVGALVRIRIIEESLSSPGVAIGFDSQGEGGYLQSQNRFRQKSKGAYLVMSRNYSLWGDFGLHGGVNYSFEDDSDHDPSFWTGFDKAFGSHLEFCGEYDFATNDNEDRSMTADRGFLNAGCRIHLNGAFTLELNVRNLLRNEKAGISGAPGARPEPARELRFSYFTWF
jgi:hypothetical protein